MKILHISSSRITYPGGGEKIVLDMARESSKRHDVTVLQTTINEDDVPFKKEDVIDGIKVITCKNDRWLGGFGYSKGFKKVLKNIWKDYDVVHIHGHGRFTSFFAFQFLKDKLPIVYTPHGFFHTNKFYFIKKIHDLFYNKLIKYSTYFIALSELDKQKFMKIGIPEKKIEIIPNFINIKEFRMKSNRTSFLKKYGLNPKNKTILCLGRIHKSKGLQYVVEAVKDLDVNLIIAGRDVGFVNVLKRKISDLKIGGRVKIMGEVSSKNRLKCYANCDIFILFSQWEGFGIVMIEAMAAGLPVIVSDRGPLPTIVKDGKNGLVAKFPDVRSLKEKISMLIRDKKLYDKIKLNEKRFVKRFDTEKVVKRIEELYGKAVKG